MTCKFEAHIDPANEDTLTLADVYQQIEHIRLNVLYSVDECKLPQQARLHLLMAVTLLEQARIHVSFGQLANGEQTKP